ncbi:ABC transporter ATP-binding protein [Paenarthrobacter sp. Z7-10]|uniref:ABC transporter ATP-binding protein n=1 Tax=Paenarthrobacter sp. Z7-10 TaxID=2787635 RepID=UPI0022A97625|nr:ABC transporter ATP-binding protein [Paenarthrobacter sp. Z7-10]MCZ2405053.1 ABC transporter ATP-binding protein [Paenarthrobacter sp. Z7-10]
MRLQLDTFSYPGDEHPTLHGIDLAVQAGDCVLVAGGSGSGKSTLARILAAVLPGRHGGVLTARFDMGGETLWFSAGGQHSARPDDPASALAATSPDVVNPRINAAVWNRHLAYVGQDPSAQLSTVAATVAEEIAFALENSGMDRVLMKERVRLTARDLGLTDLLQRNPNELSGGEQRRMIIASAAALNPDFLVLDEPTAGLDADARRYVRTMIESLLARGAGIVLLTPELGGIGRLAARVHLLDGGRIVASGPRSTMLRSAEAARLPLLPDAVDTASAAVAAAAEEANDGGPGALPHAVQAQPVAELQDVVYRYGDQRRRRLTALSKRSLLRRPTVLDGVNLTLRAGERVAIAGANGAGKSTLLRHLNGLARPESGTVRILDRNIAGEPVGSVARDVAYLFQDPQDQLFERTVAREVAYGMPVEDSEDRDAAVQHALERCGLTALAQEHPYELPASARRLVALATVLVRRPSLLAMDEPTVSMDRDGVDRLARAIKVEAARGAAVAVVTHNLDFAYAHCSRLVLLSSGRIVADGPFMHVLEQHFGGGEAFGVQAPAAWMRSKGVDSI